MKRTISILLVALAMIMSMPTVMAHHYDHDNYHHSDVHANNVDCYNCDIYVRGGHVQRHTTPWLYQRTYTTYYRPSYRYGYAISTPYYGHSYGYRSYAYGYGHNNNYNRHHYRYY